MPRPLTSFKPARVLLYATLMAVAALAAGPIVPTRAQVEAPPPGDGDQAKPEKEPQQQPTMTDALGGPDRYLTHLSTDKPIYRTGETVYVRGTILDAFTHKPFDPEAKPVPLPRPVDDDGAEEDAPQPEPRRFAPPMNLAPMVEIKDPKGAVIASTQVGVEDSVFGFSWVVPDGQAGGEYTIKVTHPWSGLAPAERTFDIRAYRAPRLRSQIEFLKDGYGPGDTVVATIVSTRAEGGVPAGAKVTVIARVDGGEVARVETTMSDSGTAEARFDLPAEIERGEGSLAFVIEDGGVVETASKTLPILLQTVDLDLYPEGGDLVAGVMNRVYFEAKTPYGKPADIKGVLVGFEPPADSLGGPVEVITEFSTTHEGRGVFAFTPEAGKAYTLRITEPSSVTQKFELPVAVERGAVVRPLSDSFAFDSPIAIHLGTAGLVTEPGKPYTAIVNITQREAIVASMQVEVPADGDLVMPLTFLPESNVDAGGEQPAMTGVIKDSATGVLTVTVYDGAGSKPLAERLIYRAPKNRVNIEILPDSAQYTPSGKVLLQIKTTDSNGNPIAAVAGLTVTDDSVLEMIETREQAPALPAMVLLEPEVKDLADAAVYLDPNNPDAAQQLDLLLGTQGWRRFALVNLEDFIREHGDDARRALAVRVPVELERRRMMRAGAANGAVDFDGAPAPEAAVREMAEGPAAPVDDLAGIGGEEKVLNGPEAPDQAEFQLALEEAAQKQQGQALFADRDDAAGRRIMMPPMVYVREYAHKQPAGKPFGERSDFTETVYWSATTKTNAQGLATVEFDLSDSVTSFRVKADAFTKDGALGAGTGVIESVRPFYVEPKLPLELTAGDTVLLPIAMVNNTDRELPVTLLLSRLGKAGTVTLDPVNLAADTRGRSVYELAIGETYGELAFNIEARAGELFDENKRSIRVVPKGFPIRDGSGGMLNPDDAANDEVVIPDTVVPGSLSATVTVYPTPLANLTEALEALIRDPYGCFEQTSSTTFPLVMAQQYFLTHQGVDPQLIATAREKLDAGYQRLIGFETQEKGYEWFGSTPPHEALTAYGLLQFNEMKEVMDVDQAMVARTQDWLMSRCGTDGSFQLDPKQLDSFGAAPQDTTDAYIVWSLLEAGYDPAKIEKSINHVMTLAGGGEDTYIIALAANITAILGEQNYEPAEFLSVGYAALNEQFNQKLVDKLNDEGYVDGAVTSITRSGGDALNIETTSLAILAWLRDDSYTPQVEKSILWLTERCKQGRFGSTQSTVLALKAIVAYDKARSTPKAPGDLILLIDGVVLGEPVSFDQTTTGAIKLPDFADKLTPGKHTIAVLMDGGSKMPYSIAINYHAEVPASSEQCKLRIETQVAPTLITSNANHVVVGEGEVAEVNVKVTNVTQDGLPTPVAIVGIPGGLEPSFDQLKELIDAGTIAAFEVIGRDVVLYWREMKPGQVVELPIRCTAAVPGTYTGPASRTYLYYTDEHKQWADGLTVTITPRGEE